MFHAKIVDIKEKKISLSDAEKFISSNTYGASIFLLELYVAKITTKM